MMMTKQSNWAGNYEYHALKIHHPKKVADVRELVKHSKKVRALGTRHSFNNIADSPENLISLDSLEQTIELDREHLTVTVSGGVRYGELGQYLHQQGFALHNLASLPHISIAGACATATHGSGNRNGNLATAVCAMELVTAGGDTLVVSHEQEGDRFQGMVVGLGAFGIVTKLTLNILPTFNVQQDVYQNLPLSELKDHFDQITSDGYSVSLFTDWKSEKFNQVWLKRLALQDGRASAAPNFFGAVLATRNLHPIEEFSAENCTEQMGTPGPWHERLPHFRMDHTPSSGEELQSEYFVPRQHAYEALLEINRLRESIAPLLQISEIRMIAADDLWMSPCYHQDCVAIHFTWKKNEPAARQILRQIEERLARFEVRPHWGKLFEMSPARLASRFARLQDFRELLSEYDPQGKFRNSFLDTYIFGTK
jgi:alditol oxidase